MMMTMNDNVSEQIEDTLWWKKREKREGGGCEISIRLQHHILLQGCIDSYYTIYHIRSKKKLPSNLIVDRDKLLQKEELPIFNIPPMQTMKYSSILGGTFERMKDETIDILVDNI